MSAISEPVLRLDRVRGVLRDAQGRRFDAAARAWVREDAPASAGEALDPIAAATWLQRASGHPLRVPAGVIGPREASPAQLALAEEVGRGLARMGLVVVCGGRQGVMEATCRGVAAAGGSSIGILPEADPAMANPHVGIVLATGIGEARNALIARAAFCLIAIGDSFGTLSEVAFGRQFGKRVVGLAGAARVDGVVHVADAQSALAEVARAALALESR
jgi:uncharacterized protein (TIGR00725 family)